MNHKPKLKPKKRASHSQAGSIRIIGGKYRGRKLTVGNREGLRPTGNRIRETLFNWLSQDISDAICVDLFSGSGALAFEAASRHAKIVHSIELDPQSAQQLKAQATQFNCDTLQVHHQRAEQWLAAYSGRIDIAFVDPPFHQNLHNHTLELLTNHGGCHEQTRIYVEADCRDPLVLPENWGWHRQNSAGDVIYGLLAWQAP